MHDRRTGLCFTQICVGNISDATRPCPWSQTPGTIGDRIEYTHYPVVTSSEGAVDLNEFSSNTNAFGVRKSGWEGGDEVPTGVPRQIVSVEASIGSVGVVLGQDAHPALYRNGHGKNEIPDGAEKAETTHVRHDRGLNIVASRLKPGGEGGGGGASGDIGGRRSRGISGTQRQPHFPLFSSSPSYALVSVLSEPLESTIEAELVEPRGAPDDDAMQVSTGSAQPNPRALRAILGPVVGKVDVTRQFSGIRESCRVCVLLEVDGDGVVSCLVSFNLTLNAVRSPPGTQPR